MFNFGSYSVIKTLKTVSKGNSLGVTPRTLEPKLATNFMIFKRNLVFVTHFIEYH